jgi:hypothetical protein
MKGGSKRTRHHPGAVAAAAAAAVRGAPTDAKAVAYVEEGSWQQSFSAGSTFQQGFGVGLWMGALAAAGAEVVPVPATRWKPVFGLSGHGAT